MGNEKIIIQTNEFQTPITQDLLDSMSSWVQEQFIDFIDNVPLLRWMISPDRPRAKDLPRDADGKIIVDIAHPHILEDVDYFRPAARHFEEHGCYTFLKPNPNPKSEYGKWITEEARRCREGYVRESDGEWVTGFMYWYLNYCRIKLTKKNPKTGVSSQVPGFPLFWEGVYYRYHYIDQARKAGKHCIELARRGAGKSYSLAGIMDHNLHLGENEFSKEEVNTILAGYTTEYLSQKDGTLDKFVKMKDFVSKHTEFPRLLSTNRPSDMLWIAGSKDVNGVVTGSKNAVMGVAVKDDEAKVRGKRGFILFEEMGSFKNLLPTYNNVRDSVKDGDEVFALVYLVGCVCAGTKVWLPDGRLINIEDLKQKYGIYGFDGEKSVAEEIEQLTTPKLKPCVEIQLQDRTSLKCSVDHPIYVQRRHQYAKYLGNYKYEKAHVYFTYEWVAAGNMKVGDRVCEARRIPAFGKDTLFDARLVGMLIGDGFYGYDNTPKYSSEDAELLNYVESRYDTGLSASHITKKGNVYKDIRVKGICSHLREIGIYGQTHAEKRLPSNYQTLTQEDSSLLLAGLFDTDGTVSVKNCCVELCQSNKEILEQVSILLRKFGIFGTIREYKPRLGIGRKDKNPYYRLTIAGRVNMYYFQSNIPLLCKHKKKSLDDIVFYLNNTQSKKEPRYDTSEIVVSTVKAIMSVGDQLVYNMTVSGSHTYLANNIITHNTAGDKDSDFSGAREILYNPEGYEIYPIENVYDLEGKGRKKFGYFFPSYISRTGCMDKDGNSDVVKALITILNDRDTVRRTKPETLLSVIAQRPITPEEAILRVRKGYFPTDLLNERLRYIDQHPHFYDQMYVGTLVESNHNVVFRKTDDIPIRDWPVKKSNTPNLHGALEIYKMPPDGDIPPNRYVLGIDPIENDEDAESESLFAMIMFDLFNDEPAAWYFGRMERNEDNCYLAWLMCRFYNAKCMPEANKKNVYAYFAQKRSIYMLADCPEYLKEREIVKYSMTGSSGKGVQALPAIISLAQDYIKDWLLKQYVTNIEDDSGRLQTVTVPGVNKIACRVLLKEMISYGPGENTDMVSALMQVMLYRQQYMILYGEEGQSDEEEGSDDADDEFFYRGWNKVVERLGEDHRFILED